MLGDDPAADALKSFQGTNRHWPGRRQVIDLGRRQAADAEYRATRALRSLAAVVMRLTI